MCFVLILELYWCLPTKIAMSASGVAEPFDVFEHRFGKIGAGVPVVSIVQFDSHPPPEGIDHGVVVRVTDGAQ